MSPEAAVGGGIALLKTNDRLRIDLNKRSVNVLISDEELEQRRREWKPTVSPSQTPWQEMYRNMVGQLSTGGCLEPATLYMRVVNQDNLQDTLINFRIFVMTIIGHNFIGGSRSAQGTTLLKVFKLRLVKLCLMSFTMQPSKRLIRPVKQPVKPLRLTAIPHLNSVLF